MKKKNKTIQITFCFFMIFHFLFLNSFSKQMAMAQNTTIPVKVGVVLDMDTWLGKMGLSAIQMALLDFYASHHHYKTRLILHSRDSNRDVVTATSAALDLLKNTEVQTIIGPQSSMQADFIIALGDKAQVPIVSFSATSPSLSSIRSPYFIRTTLNDSSQVKAISAIVEAFGWRQAVPIYVDNEFGEGIIPFLVNALDEINCRVPYRSVIPPLATDDEIVAELYKLMTMQTRVFIVHMLTPLASRLFTIAKHIGMLNEGYVWIITDGLTNTLGLMDPSVVEFMSGVIGIKPYIPSSKELKDFTTRWKIQFQQKNPTVFNPQLNAYVLWAYDSVTAIAMAAEKAGVMNFGFHKSNISGNSTDLQTLGVSGTGPQLLRSLLAITFRGLSGDFRIVNEQLQSSAYQIVNVIGHGARVIGFWTRDKGIVKELDFTEQNTYSTSRANFKLIIWPGDTTSVPKGWVIPTNGKKMKIGVPMKDGFREFVKVTQNFATNKTEVEGYCIDVFDAVMANLPYSVPYEYIPYAKPDGESAGSYNDLVYQVYEGNYDAAVGDITIVANRSNYVDFTLPYTESGVIMVVPIRFNKRKNAWVFLKPLTWDLWVTSFFSIIFIGFVIWVLEHRINEEFRGPPLHQVGMIFWFAFSTMVFAHKEKIVSNLARFVLIIWFLVVLILTQSYTASLTSMLTVQKLQPTITDVHELLRNREYVGYPEGSFVFELLKRMNFDESKLISYGSPEECNELFSKGSRNGGIAAAFGEIPFMKLLLARYCSKYTMVRPTYKTDGFGFVFPIGSLLVRDVSRSILNVTQGETMVNIEKKWIGYKTDCQDSSDTSLSSNSLGLESFWGLFLIAGIASISAIIIFVAVFLHHNWHFIRRSNPYSSPWSKTIELAKRFDNKDLSSHTFKKSDLKGSSSTMEASPHSNCPYSPPFSLSPSPHINVPPSPSFSSHTESYLASPRKEGAYDENVNSSETWANNFGNL